MTELTELTRRIQQTLMARGIPLTHGDDGEYGPETARGVLELLVGTEAPAGRQYPWTDDEGRVWLSQHFQLAEFTRSQTASRRGIDNTPSAAQIRSLCRLCEHVLEPVRAHFGRPVGISSGFRSDELNRAIGGSRTSQHSRAEAADFEIAGVSNYEVARWMEKNLNYDQLILEMYTPGQPNSGWIHVSYSGAPHRNEELTAFRRGGKMVYVPGLRA